MAEQQRHLGQTSKADARRHTKKQSYYAKLYPKIAVKKDRRVARSSHGKFMSVKELEAHRNSVTA